MARIARVVAPGCPHHITQRGNRRQPTFFQDCDYQFYLSLLSERCKKAQVQIWAYCLMPNHVHLVAVPSTSHSLKEAIGETHRRYTSAVNKKMGWSGYLWQGRFASYPMDELYLLAAVRYIERNPFAAGLVSCAEQYRWSSAAYHLGIRKSDPVLHQSPLNELISDWDTFLQTPADKKVVEQLSKAERTGRPLGSEQFVKVLEQQLGRCLRKNKPGPKTK